MSAGCCWRDRKRRHPISPKNSKASRRLRSSFTWLLRKITANSLSNFCRFKEINRFDGIDESVTQRNEDRMISARNHGLQGSALDLHIPIELRLALLRAR